jgi:hypothetical protein
MHVFYGEAVLRQAVYTEWRKIMDTAKYLCILNKNYLNLCKIITFKMLHLNEKERTEILMMVRMVGIEKGRLIPIRKNTFLEAHDVVIEINNFEFDGSDGHLILERFVSKKSEEREVMDDAPRLVYVSGRTKEAVISTTLEHLNRKQVNHSRMEKKLKKKTLRNSINMQ